MNSVRLKRRFSREKDYFKEKKAQEHFDIFININMMPKPSNNLPSVTALQ
jgi:hypothetical protein